MSLHFLHSLRQWLPLRHQHRWILGAVVATSGSVYRKTGALMLLSEDGHQLGLLSGGCLEGDLLLQARKLAALGGSRTIVYDASDEDGIAWRLGIGCGGRAEILLQPCSADNHFLQLESVLNLLERGSAVRYQISLAEPWAEAVTAAKHFDVRVPGVRVGEGNAAYVETLINPPPHLLVFGSGIDLIPLLALADTIGWQVTLVDHRLTPQKRARFSAAANMQVVAPADLPVDILQNADAALVAYHNMQLDAAAVCALQNSSCRYLGLLGPQRRRDEVLGIAGFKANELRVPVAGPAGLGLGGDLPESVALSMLAEAHAVLFGSTGKPLSDVYLSA
ncbi:MAG: XdhC family protein [Cellvibrionaceae bacterium]|nr:XdhC family protein [Cellvibrionaceae bacterium]